MADNFGNMTITAANCTLFLTVPGLYDSPVQIEGFSTDAMVSVATTVRAAKSWKIGPRIRKPPGK